MSARVPVSFTNAGTCATSLLPEVNGFKQVGSRNVTVYRKLYTIDGTYIGETGNGHIVPKDVIFIEMDNHGKCTRFIKLDR
jgi:hypothetical protein